MSACTDRELALSAYLDAELDEPATSELEEHLAGCADCRTQLAALVALSDAVRRAGPLPLVDRAAGDVASEDPSLRETPTVTRAARRWKRLMSPGAVRGAAAAAVLVLALGIGYGVGRRQAAPPKADATSDVLSAHLRGLLPGRLLDVESSDRHQVKPWFAGRLDFSPPVPDLAAQGFPLLGGRVDFVDGKRAAVLVYGRRLHRIDVFVLPATDAPAVADARMGYNFLSWREGALAFVAVSDVNTADLRQLAALHAAAAAGR